MLVEVVKNSKMSKVFFISDTHFNHKNIIEYCNRPFKDVEEMNQTIIDNWNRVVKKSDIVLFLGDFALGRDVESMYDRYSKELNGTIYFLRGNHDRSKSSVRKYFTTIDMMSTFSYKGYNFILSHQPLYNGQIPEGFINIHGHIHDKTLSESCYLQTRHVNVSADAINFTPISLDEIIKNINKGGD